MIIVIMFKKFYNCQQEKMKELWGNEEDENWEKA
jgi:hypothetical protein